MAKFESEIASKGYIIFPNDGDSMMPLLRQHRDLMVIRKITCPLRKYDAVLFKRPNGAYVMHRIVKVCGLGQYLIGGDNRATAERVPEEWIIGILSEVIKDGRHIPVESEEYKAYLHTVPRRRLKLKIKRYFMRINRKVKKIFGRGKA